MLTQTQLLYALALPVVLSALLAAIGRWRGWRWVMPLAVGVSFTAAYWALGLSNVPPRSGDAWPAWQAWLLAGAPKLPPSNGTDWLFWLAIPVTVLGLLDAILGGRWGWILGASAGAVALGILRPLYTMTDPITLWATVVLLALVGVLLAWVAWFAEPRMGTAWTLLAFSFTLGAAGVMVMSSNLQTVGVYGLAAACAVGPVAVIAGRGLGSARSVAVVAGPLLAGLLVAGRYYPEPGVPLEQGLVVLAAPVLLLAGALLPVRRLWVRGIVGLLLVVIAVAAVTGPVALAAKKAAESSGSDPYGAYR